MKQLLCIFQETAEEKALEVFHQLDVNDDGELNEDEFVAGCIKDESLTSVLLNGTE